MTDALSSFSILLVRNAESGMGGQEKVTQRGSVGDNGVVCLTEDNIFDSKPLGTSALLGWFVGVLPHPEEEIKRNANQITQGLLQRNNTAQTFQNQKVWDSHWDC